MKRTLRSFLQINAYNIAFIYLIVGILYILFSDQLVVALIEDQDIINSVQSLKGIFFVVSTALGLLFLIRFSNRQIREDRKIINQTLKAVKIATWDIKPLEDSYRYSDNALKILGFEEGSHSWDLEEFYRIIHPDDKMSTLRAYIDALQTGRELKAEFRIVWPDDTKHWIRCEATLLRDEEENLERITGIIADVTEQKELQQQADRRRELFESIFENIPVMIDIYDPRIENIRVNPAFEKTLGWSNREIRNINLMEACYPDPEERERAITSMKKADGSWSEYEVETKQGEKRYQEWANVKLSDETTIGIGIDTTQLKESERHLQQITQRYRKAEEIADLGHWKRDLSTGETVWSEGLYRIMNRDPLQVDTRYESILENIHPEDREMYEQAYQEALKKGSLNVRYRIILPESDEVVYLKELAETEFDGNGEAVSISGSVQDTTEAEKFQIKLHQRNKFIETTLEKLPIGVAVNLIDSGKATLMNEKFSRIYGWPKEEIVSVESFFEKVYPDPVYRATIKEMITRDLESGDPARMNWKNIRITTQTGQERIIDAKNITVYEQNLMISTVMDVTARIRAQEQLRKSEHHYRLLFERSPQPMFIYDPSDLSIVRVNDAAVRKYGYSKIQFENLSLLDIRPAEEHKVFEEAVQYDIQNNLSKEREAKHQTKDGTIINVVVTGSAIDYFGKDFRMVLINDITEQKKAEEKVLSSFVEGENKERARMARELHDGLGQYLAAANMNLDAIEESISQLNELETKKKTKFQSGLQYLRHAIQETNTIAHNLVPRVIEDYGLALAIESLVENYSKNSELHITFSHNIESLEQTGDRELNIYRIIQESVSNAVKYSQADTINIQLFKDQLDLILTIDDNGIGFDRNHPDFKPGLGLQTIKTRAGALGGTLDIESSPGNGTFIHAEIPIVTESTG